MPSARPTPGSRSSLRSDGYPPAESRSVLVVPPHLDGFLRAEVAGLLHPAAGQGFVAFHAHRRPRSRPSEDGPARDAHSGDPRDAVHTLRSLPSVDSRTASLRPLPPCRYRPAEAGRRSDSVKLRSAEADPHVTEREVPLAAEAARGQPRRTSAIGAFTTRRGGWLQRGPGDRTRAGVGPPRTIPTTTRCRPKASPGCTATEAAERAGGCIATAEADGMRVRRTIAERIGFEALLRRQSPLSSGRRCQRPTLVPSMGFVPLRGPSCVRSLSGTAVRRRRWRRRSEAASRVRRCLAGDSSEHGASRSGPVAPSHDRRSGRASRRPPKRPTNRSPERTATARTRWESSRSPGSLPGFTRGAGPEPFVAAARGRPKPGHGPAPFQRIGRGPRVATPQPAGRSRIRREASARRVCPEHES
jgi:hypothetical protein